MWRKKSTIITLAALPLQATIEQKKKKQQNIKKFEWWIVLHACAINKITSLNDESFGTCSQTMNALEQWRNFSVQQQRTTKRKWESFSKMHKIRKLEWWIVLHTSIVSKGTNLNDETFGTHNQMVSA
jgi:hypothetical protein